MLLLPIRIFASSTVTVDTQELFDSIPQLVRQQLEQGEKDVNIHLAGKTFHFAENHIQLKGLQYPKANVSISGEDGTVIVSRGMWYTNGGTYKLTFKHQHAFIDGDFREVSLWGNMHTATDTINVVDAERKVCFIPYKGLKSQSAELCNYTYVLVTTWYTSEIYKVREITADGVYFICSNLRVNAFPVSYNVNVDYSYSKLVKAPLAMPRFKLCNSMESANNMADGRIRTEAKSLFECRNATFLSLKDCHLRSFRIEGITFAGNADVIWNGALITCADSRFRKGFYVARNMFRNMKNTVVSMRNTDNLFFEHNSIENCALGVVEALNDCANATVAHNTFRRCGTRLTNSPVVHVNGSSYHVHDNLFEDFGYTAISSGVHWTLVKEHPCSGVIEDNEIYYTAETFRNKKEFTLMDSGAIYISTQNDNTIIRNNYIHDYTGMIDYRGIFCDDGASNCHVLGNKIRNTPSCYSIQLSAFHYANDPRSKTDVFCQGNTVKNNDCDNDVKVAHTERNAFVKKN